MSVCVVQTTDLPGAAMVRTLVSSTGVPLYPDLPTAALTKGQVRFILPFVTNALPPDDVADYPRSERCLEHVCARLLASAPSTLYAHMQLSTVRATNVLTKSPSRCVDTRPHLQDDSAWKSQPVDVPAAVVTKPDEVCEILVLINILEKTVSSQISSSESALAAGAAPPLCLSPCRKQGLAFCKFGSAKLVTDSWTPSIRRHRGCICPYCLLWTVA